ncbi:hypothetical protein RIF29_21937 [Crotalaria pallida]|uniref:Uncharacterized protein n=1 Tax=Crotalaria pallida TaxID=3830 RepID=A0AAN9F409_CROPI
MRVEEELQNDTVIEGEDVGDEEAVEEVAEEEEEEESVSPLSFKCNKRTKCAECITVEDDDSLFHNN